ncbi:hypothetical protein QQS21_000897 [Conoideocrella luteorostrata]|uniref:Glucose-methanol-choline oxidoreductase N-terminal domain-containing protein n=1 Tax=Conoideocrella luteorostrata TaxID=1105319 RepID=A0AAJ0CYB0_9HYPO|nr:hypothetical protein QQS21_000897 [Conoideocrella luteorostrata]
MGSFEAGREYDIIIAGGGTAGCIVAGRLAEADPNLSILVIEQGQNNLNNPTIVTPAIYPSHLLPDSKTAIFYKGNKEEAINGRELIVPAGAQACDYDSWNTEGWDSKTLMSLSKKLETFHFDGPDYDKSLHGYDGPISVSNGTYGPIGPQDDVIAGAVAVGEKEVVDLQDFKTASGFSRWGRYISPDGKRQDTAHKYIHPLMASGKHPNLHLLVENMVSRVIFEGSRAVGVECQPAASGAEGKPSIITAKKMVVVSAGALGTPQVLERSGVGNKEALDKLDISVVSDLPQVGENYQDHNLIGYSYKTSLGPKDTLDALLSGRLDFVSALQEQNPILGWNGIDIAAKVRPSEQEVAQLGPVMKECWDRDFKEQIERPLMLMGVVSFSLGNPKDLAESVGGLYQYMTMACYTAYPYSRGNVHIVSKDVFTPPSFNTGYLSHPADVKKLLWAYKKQREIMRRTNMFEGEVPIAHPKFREGSKAALLNHHPVDGGYKSAEERRNLPPIEYDAEDDAAIEDYIRTYLTTPWHSLGTCKMAPREKGGVVDKDLNVYGMEGLKLADLSICPENVGANTNNTALIVGEKAAFIIGRELGLKISG